MPAALAVEPGTLFADWEVIEEAERRRMPNGAIHRQFLCRCTSCNETVKVVSLLNLRSGGSLRCRQCAEKLKSDSYREKKHHLTMVAVGVLKCLPDFTEEQFTAVFEACMAEAQKRGVD